MEEIVVGISHHDRSDKSFAHAVVEITAKDVIEPIYAQEIASLPQYVKIKISKERSDTLSLRAKIVHKTYDEVLFVTRIEARIPKLNATDGIKTIFVEGTTKNSLVNQLPSKALTTNEILSVQKQQKPS